MPNDPHRITDLNARVAGSPQGGGGLSDESGVGEIFYVNNDSTNLLPGAEPGADRSDFGKTPNQPLATIDYAIGLCAAGRGDKIIVMPGHAETITAAITMDVQGVTIEGRGRGANRPAISCATASIDEITITAADCKVENLLFNESTAAVTSFINVAAANVVVEGCHFDCGATDLEPITWASGAGLKVLDNYFVITANGPDAAIEIEATGCDRLICKGNIFNGGNATNVWDAAAINSTVAHTNALIEDNVFMYGIAYIVATSVSSSIGKKNQYLMGAASNAAAPQEFYCDLGTTIRDGKSPETPTTLNDALVTKATAGDKVYVLAGSSVTLTSAQALSVAGVSLIGLGVGANRPQITVNAAIDGLNMNGANCRISNLYFNEMTHADATSFINIAAANCEVDKCHFDMGANDQEGITIADAGDNAIVRDCEFIITADGPDAAIEIEDAGCDGIQILDNFFMGDSVAAAWDAAAINSTVAHTNMLIEGNKFMYGNAYVIATSVSTSVGSKNEYLMGSWPNAAAPQKFYADNGSTIRDGKSIETPTTVADAYGKARAGIGDSVLLLPGTYTLGAAYALSKAAMKFGPAVDNGAFNVTLTTAGDFDLITLTGANCEIWGLRFLANAAQTTTPMLIDLDTGDFCRIHDCYFDANSVADVISVDVASTAADTLIDHNYFVGQVVTIGSIVDLGARTKVLDNMCEQLAADGYFINNDGLAVGGAMYLRNYILGDGGAGAAMILFDSTAPVQFLCAQNYFGGTTSATPFGQDAEWTTMFVNNYVASAAGGALIDPVA